MNGCLLFLLSLLFGLMVCIALLLGLSLASDIRNDFQSANLDLRIEIIGAPKATASPEAERMPVLIYVINDQPALSVPTSVPLLPQSAPNYQITPILPTLGAPMPACHPSYQGVCLPLDIGDLDCGQIGDHNFLVVGPDVYNLDGDHNGLACER